jgi:hypothetical protein
LKNASFLSRLGQTKVFYNQGKGHGNCLYFQCKYLYSEKKLRVSKSLNKISQRTSSAVVLNIFVILALFIFKKMTALLSVKKRLKDGDTAVLYSFFEIL